MSARCDRCGTEWVGIGLHTNGDCATIAALRIALTAATARAERAEQDARAWQSTADECERDKTAISRALVEMRADLTERAERAEAERDEARALKVPPSVDELNAALMRAAVARVERDVATARAEAAEAEVARLREQHSEERTRIEHASTRALAIRQAAHLFAHAATYSGETVINRILDLLDAAPAAEGGE